MNGQTVGYMKEIGLITDFMVKVNSTGKMDVATMGNTNMTSSMDTGNSFGQMAHGMKVSGSTENSTVKESIITKTNRSK